MVRVSILFFSGISQGFQWFWCVFSRKILAKVKLMPWKVNKMPLEFSRRGL